MKCPYPDLQLDEDIEFHRTQWRIERAGWIVICLTLISAVLGLTGSGGLADSLVRSEIAAGPNTAIVLPRFVRWQSPVELRVRTVGRGGGRATVWIGQDYLEAFDVRDTVPQPDRAEFMDGGVMYTFRVSPGSIPEVRFRTVPKRFGALHGRIGPGPDSARRVHQFSYP